MSNIFDGIKLDVDSNIKKVMKSLNTLTWIKETRLWPKD